MNKKRTPSHFNKNTSIFHHFIQHIPMSDLLLVDTTRKQCIFPVCASMTEALPIIRSSKLSTATSRVYCLASGENYEGSENICSGEHT